ncbi:MAG: hypothetical protein BWY31_02930 [Lentisphaerae bacterium ADurb.Bin242]|nr:MAG: hypothetical protein BWY31_02930 [Lentisphaerae bacterium ADurb.Bin242]
MTGTFKVSSVLFFLSAALFSAELQITENADAIILQSGGAEYVLDKKQTIRLKSFSLDGKKLWLENEEVALRVRDQYKWWTTSSIPWKENAGPVEIRIEKSPESITVKAVSEGKNIRLTRIRTIRKGNPALESTVRLETRGPIVAEWGYLSLFSMKDDTRTWFRLNPVEENGLLQYKVRIFEESPFYDRKLKKRKKVSRELSMWNSFALIGQYDKTINAGIVFSLLPDAGIDSLLMGGGTENTFIAMRCGGIGPGKEKWVSRSAHFSITPFHGAIRQNAEKILSDEYMEKLKKADVIPYKQDTGRLLVKSEEADIWFDHAGTWIFRNEKAPRAKESAIFLKTAKNANVLFQAAVRAGGKTLPKVSLEISDLVAVNGEKIEAGKFSWHPLEFVRNEADILSGPTLEGEVGDILGKTAPIDCAAGKTQPFLIRFRVPSDASSGLYDGQIRVLSDGKKRAEIPLRLKVWNFALPEKTAITAILNPWAFRTPMAYRNNPAMAEEARKDVYRQVADARGTWYCRKGPEVEWDKDGNLVKMDTRAFDTELQEVLRQSKAPRVFNSFARFGVGGVPQKKSFWGTKEEIGTDVWKKRVASFAKAFHAYLKEKNLLDTIVLDVFDEPSDEWLEYLRENLTVFRENAPGVKLTAPMHYTPRLDGLLDIWMILLYPEATACSPELLRHFQSMNAELMVYNPGFYENISSYSGMRGLYWWMWRSGAGGMLQWCVTLWPQFDNASGWNAFNNATWMVPQPDGLRSTMRMEMSRAGGEDCEMFVLLEKSRDALRKTGHAAAAAEAEALLAEVGQLSSSWGNLFSPIQNGEKMEVLRNRIGDFLDRHFSERGK